MIPPQALLASRIRQDLTDLQQVVERVERAVRARRLDATDADLLLDSAALNLHDLYNGLERIFTQIASNVDQSLPAGPNSHRELLRQMTLEIPGQRPRVLSAKVAGELDEFLRFRHVVRHTYAFALEPERVERLAARLRPAFHDVSSDLQAFAAFLDGVANGS